MEFIAQYLMFLAKAVTIVVAIIFIISALGSNNKGKRPGRKGNMKVTRLNDHYDDMKDELRFAVLDKDELKQTQKLQKKEQKAEAKSKKKQLKEQAKSDAAQSSSMAETASVITQDADEPKATNSPAVVAEQVTQVNAVSTRKQRVYVLNFIGDPAAEAVDSLREEITTLLAMAEPQDEVVLRLESPGGMVHAYGLAASQLARIRDRKIPLTICVDKVAASGGYMMACLADKLIAAPFAYIGSIGVLVSMPNFHRVLKKYDVDYELISAGEFKRTLTPFGEVTEKGREKVQEEVEEMHEIFKDWVKQHRPSVDVEKVGTGETWIGTLAKERYMVDEIRTSDECIAHACENADVYELEYEIRKSLQDKLSAALEGASTRLISAWFNRASNDKYYQ